MVTTTILDVGAVRPIHKGAWSSTATYDTSNIVSYDGSSWMMSASSYTVGTTPVDGDTWNLLAAKGSSLMEDASTTTRGVAYLATDAEITAGTNTTKIVTPKHLSDKVSAEISSLVNSAPEALDTLNELAAALGDDANFATTVATNIGTVSTAAATAQASADAVATTTTTGRVSVGTGLEVTAAGALSISSENQTTLSGAASLLTEVSVDAGALKVVRADSSGKISSGYLPAASESISGIVERATNEEASAGTDTERFVTPHQLKNYGAVAAGAYRLSRIGTAMPVASTTLDNSYKIADGSLVLFADYPELEAKYEANGLMVLDAESTSDEQTAKPLYFVAHSEGTGLYLPRLSGLFACTWTCEDDGTAGGYNAAGLPNITGAFNNPAVSNGFSGAFYSAPGAVNNYTSGMGAVNSPARNFSAELSNPIYGNSTTVMPESYNQPMAIYLGQPATTTE